MKKVVTGNHFHGLRGSAVAGFVISLALCSFLIIVSIINRMNMEELKVERLVAEKSLLISDEIERPLYKTQALAALVVQGNGDIKNFDKIASMLIHDAHIANVLIAPDGVVSRVYPVQGNEAVLGLDLFNSGPGGRAAFLAKESGRFTLSASFEGVQGRNIIAGRMPVYLDTPDGRRTFWGIVSVTLPFPEVLDNVGMETFEEQGYAYQLRVNTGGGTAAAIVSSSGDIKEGSSSIRRYIQIYGAAWQLFVSNTRMWYDYPENIASVLAGIIISFLVLLFMQNNSRLSRISIKLEYMATSDPLTGIYNRRYFMERMPVHMKRVYREGQNGYMIIFDLDNFKKVNDEYGHLAGDEVLIETTSRIRRQMRSGDLFARFGGEEFIIFVPGGDDQSARQVAERMRLSIAGKVFEYEEVSLVMTASFGVAKIEDNQFEEAIRQADEALYKAKNEGRNKVVLYAPADVTRTAG